MTTALAATDELIDQFLGNLSDKGFADNTVTAYGADISQLREFLWEQKGCTNWRQVTKAHMGSYIPNLEKKKYANASISRKAAAVKSFFKFLVETGILKSNPTDGLVPPKSSKPSPKILSQGQMATLLEQPAKQSTPAALRDTAMMELLYATGLRVTELVSLDLGNLSTDHEKSSVRVYGKGAKHRFIPIHQQAVLALIEYLNRGRPKISRTKWERALFLSRHGERMTRQGFWLLLRQHAKDAEVVGVTPNIIRHSFASHMLDGGAMTKIVQNMLGHANIYTTQIYERPNDETQRVYRASHPRDI